MIDPKYRAATFKGLLKGLGLRRRREASMLQQALQELLEEGRIKKSKRGRFFLEQNNQLVKGTIQGHARGFAFLIPENREEEDIFIKPNCLQGAMHGDEVLVKLSTAQRRGRKREGEVVKILKRRSPFMVGSFRGSKRRGSVIPDDQRLVKEIVITKKKGIKPVAGDKVVVKITQWPRGDRVARGEIDQVLGAEGEKGVDVLSVIKKHGLREKFPAAALREAEEVARWTPGEPYPSERLDLRSIPMVTIDGEDAKDLDDAVSLETRCEGGWTLGVHIADVSFYVKENSLLDKEALRRGTSVYLVDRVLPMLPPRLSNEICSLNPGVDRLAMSVMMEISPQGEVENYRFALSIVRIDERMTYKNVAAILDGDETLSHQYAPWVDTFREMHKLSSLLRSRRLERGAIDFAFPEPKVHLDEEGHPISIEVRWQGPAENIIEEFMILCNEVVAGHFAKKGLPLIYRIHEKPQEEKVVELRETLSLFNIRLKGSPSKIKPSHYQKVLQKVRASRWEKMVSYLLLRSLTQARYSPDNVGHFGLASPVYCHFTAPIRRYPDLVVHRLLRHLLTGELKSDKWQKMLPQLSQIAAHASEQERLAVEAERESVDLKKLEFMEGKEGEEFAAIINGVTSFGLFVELENTVEGLVHISSIEGDYYRFEEKSMSLRGERTHTVFRLGDPVTVRLHRVNKEEGLLDFRLV